MKYIYLLLILFTTTTTFSQSITTRDITWTAAKSLEQHSNVTINQTYKLVTHKNTSIDLVSPANTLSFAIASIEGSWSDAAKDGVLMYHVKYQDRPGKITLTRTGADIIAVIDFTESMPDALNQKIYITSYK